MDGKRICQELKALNNVILRQIEKTLPTECDRMTANNGWILGYLAANRSRDVFGRDLEEEFSITRSTVSKVIEIMESKGLIRRESVDYDARLKKLVLTEKAEKLVTDFENNAEKFEKVLMHGFGEEEKQQFFLYMCRMRCNLEHFDEEEWCE